MDDKENYKIDNGEIWILIPAYNPDDSLYAYTKELKNRGFSNIVIINDGSDGCCDSLFEKLRSEKCVVIEHDTNLGKGISLKDGFYYIKKKHCLGVITVDADGQHSIWDVEKLSSALKNNLNVLILGSRNFTLAYVPEKSRVGNEVTRKILKTLYHIDLLDTQTGLRGIPYPLIDNFINISGSRYEYETNMLIECSKKNIPVKELEIQTIYLNDNKETHFRAVVDSIRIFNAILGGFLQYTSVSLLSFVVDISLFQIILLALAGCNKWEIVVATIGARSLSSFVNYMLNRKVVFKRGNCWSIVRYYGLCLIQGLISAGIVNVISGCLGWSAVLVKTVVDCGLYLVSYRIQRRYVFINCDK